MNNRQQFPDNMVVGVYKSQQIAQHAINELLKDGYSTSQIHIRSRNINDLGSPVEDNDTYGLYGNITGDLEHFFRGMTDGERREELLSEYLKVLEDGNTIVSVDAYNDLEANKAASVLSKTANVISDKTATSPSESDISDTGSWAGVKIFSNITGNNFHTKSVKVDAMNNKIEEKNDHKIISRIEAKKAIAAVTTQSAEMLDKASDIVRNLEDTSKKIFDEAREKSRSTFKKTDTSTGKNPDEK